MIIHTGFPNLERKKEVCGEITNPVASGAWREVKCRRSKVVTCSIMVERDISKTCPLAEKGKDRGILSICEVIAVGKGKRYKII